jgi:hypothetical protein
MIEYRDHLIPYHWLPTLQDTKYQTFPCSDSHAVFQLQGVQRISHSSTSPRDPSVERRFARKTACSKAVFSVVSAAPAHLRRGRSIEMQQVVNQQVRLQWCWYQLALAVQRTYRSVERWAFSGHGCTGIIKRLQHIKYSICLQQTVETHRSGRPFC